MGDAARRKAGPPCINHEWFATGNRATARGKPEALLLLGEAAVTNERRLSVVLGGSKLAMNSTPRLSRVQKSLC
jgi:hypothetical protein